MELTTLTPDRLHHPTPCTVPQSSEENVVSFYRRLGRTDLTVSCLGLGGGGHISSEDTLYAFDQGVNTFFYSSDLHHFLYSSMAEALRQLCGRGSSQRENVILATVTYIKDPEVALSALLDQFHELGLDYVDIFFWGWVGSNDGSALDACLDLSRDLRGNNSVYQRTLERIFGVSERLKRMGAVRHIGASFHDLALAHTYLNNPCLDVVMVRHNVAHRSAQSQIFQALDPENPERPGVFTFKSTGSHSGMLWTPPVDFPTDAWVPTVPDLYRYSLSQPNVDLCLTGLRSRSEIDAAIAGVRQGALSSAEIKHLNLYGDLHRQKITPQAIPSDCLIRQPA